MNRLFSILFRLPKYLKLSWRLMTDPQTPRYLKLVVVATVLYTISPFDLIPEIFLPHLGFGDDLLLLFLSLRNLIRNSPQEIVTQHAREIAQTYDKKRQEST